MNHFWLIYGSQINIELGTQILNRLFRYITRKENVNLLQLPKSQQFLLVEESINDLSLMSVIPRLIVKY